MFDKLFPESHREKSRLHWKIAPKNVADSRQFENIPNLLENLIGSDGKIRKKLNSTPTILFHIKIRFHEVRKSRNMLHRDRKTNSSILHNFIALMAILPIHKLAGVRVNSVSKSCETEEGWKALRGQECWTMWETLVRRQLSSPNEYLFSRICEWKIGGFVDSSRPPKLRESI